MRVLFNDRYTTIGALLLLVFLGYKGYYQSRGDIPEGFEERQKNFEKRLHKNDPNYKPKYNVQIDPEKKYEDYSLSEKIAYKFFSDDVDRVKREYQLRKQIYNAPQPVEAPGKKQIGAIVGDKVTYTYKIIDIKNRKTKPQIVTGTTILGQGKIPAVVEKSLSGMAVGEARVMQIPIKQVVKSSKDNKEVLVEVQLIRIENKDVQ